MFLEFCCHLCSFTKIRIRTTWRVVRSVALPCVPVSQEGQTKHSLLKGPFMSLGAPLGLTISQEREVEGGLDINVHSTS